MKIQARGIEPMLHQTYIEEENITSEELLFKEERAYERAKKLLLRIWSRRSQKIKELEQAEG